MAKAKGKTKVNRVRRNKSVRTPKSGIDKRGTNPNSLANLKPPWQPGEASPNPGGRPKLLGESYRKWLEKPSNDNPEHSNAERVAQSIGDAAIKGDTQAAREIRAATEGDSLNLKDATFETYMDQLRRRFLGTAENEPTSV